MKKDVKISVLILIALLGVLSYANTFQNSFHFDDNNNIVSAYAIQIKEISAENILKALTRGYAPNRPVANLSFGLNYYLGSLNLFGYHLTNLIIHIITAIFLYLFIKKTLHYTERYKRASGPLALAVSLLWILHPVNTQAVTYIVQRMTSMATMFYMISFFLYTRARDKSRKTTLFYVGSFISWILALGCKEITAVFPFMIFLYEILFFKTKTKNAFLFLALWIIPLVIAGFFFIGGLDGLINILNSLQKDSFFNRDYSVSERLLTQPRVLMYYIILLLFPLSSRLALDHDIIVSKGFFNPITSMISILILILLSFYALRSLRKRAVISFGILWFISNLLIESSVFNLEMMYEHRLYLPGIGILLILTVLFHKVLLLLQAVLGKKHIVRSKTILVFLVISMALLFSYFTIKRNFIWKDSKSLWADNLKNSPNDDRVYNNLGTVLFELGDIKKAERLFIEAANKNPQNFEHYNKLGVLYTRSRNFEKGLYNFLQAYKYAPSNFEVITNLATYYRKKGMSSRTALMLRHILEKNSNQPLIYNNLGLAYIDLGLYRLSESMFVKALQIDPLYKIAYKNLISLRRLTKGKM